MTKALVLLSGGQDSTTCLFWAKEKFADLYALSFRYGQRHDAELAAAAEIAAKGEAIHLVLDVQALAQLGNSALTNRWQVLSPAGGRPDDAAPGGLPTSFVPARNLVFLSLAAAAAAKWNCRDVVIGVCQTDFSGYPDCREVFVRATEAAINLALPSSDGPIAIHAPLMYLTKADTVALARELPGCWEALGRSVTCYEGRRPGCRTCPACELRAKGFRTAGYLDPAEVDR